MTRLGSPLELGPVSSLRAEAWHWVPANAWPKPSLLSYPSSCCKSGEAKTDIRTAGRQAVLLGLWVRAEVTGFGFPSGASSGILALC